MHSIGRHLPLLAGHEMLHFTIERTLVKSLSRRSLLKQIAGVSMLAAVEPLVGCRPREKRITLNVVLHGVFVIQFTDRGITMLTPDIEEHIYRAGNWDRNAVEDLAEPSYGLRGVDYCASQPKVDSNFGFSQKDYKFTLHPEFSRFVVYLPFPEKHSFVRNVGGAIPNTPPVYDPVHINKLPLCQVLSYPVEDYRHRKLEHSKKPWQPQVACPAASANLQYW